MRLTTKRIEEIKSIHDKLREILIDYGNPEWGDCIIDEISEAVGIPPTTVYYHELQKTTMYRIIKSDLVVTYDGLVKYLRDNDKDSSGLSDEYLVNEAFIFGEVIESV